MSTAAPSDRPAVSPLRNSIAWMSLGQVVFALAQWATVVILARLGSVELVGIHALALALSAPVMIFSRLQMRQVLVTDATEARPFSDYLAVRGGTTLLGGIGVLAVAIIAGYSWTIVAVILAVGAAKAIENLSDVHYGLEQRRERLDLVGKSLILRALAGLAGFALGLVVTDSLSVAVVALAFGWAAVYWLYDRRVTRPWRRLHDLPAGGLWRHRLALARLGLPLGITVTLVSLNTNLSRYFIEAYFGTVELAAFAATAHFVLAGNLVVGAIGQAASARLANLYAAGAYRAFCRLLGSLLLLAAALGGVGFLGAVLAGAPLLGFVYGPAFVTSTDLLVWMMIAGAVAYVTSILGFGLTAMRLFRVQPLLLTAAVLVNGIGCLLLVPTFGATGAVWAWTLSLCTYAVGFVAVGLYRLPKGQEAPSPRATSV
jgi:O-antigen/teichoic acid export membrane protein